MTAMDGLTGKARRNVVLVADLVAESTDRAPLHLRRDLEQTETDTLTALADAITALGLTVTHYNGPDDLALNADRHADDVVLSIYGGSGSRSRMALVPAVCETFQLKFVGPDAYGRIIAQDKEVSKRLARDVGLRTPDWRVVRTEADVGRLDGLGYPCVLKPLLEGSSIGITQENLVHAPDAAKALWRRLHACFGQPVLAERFVSGREVSYCVIADADGLLSGFSEVYVAGRPGFFNDKLFDAGEKQNRTQGCSVRNIDELLLPTDRVAMERLLAAFGTFGYCRIDGRLNDEGFHFLELTPDAWLHPLGQFAMAFTERGTSYPDVIAAILASAD